MPEWTAIAALLAGALATQMWRWLGVALAGRIAPGGPVFEWAGCVAYALLATLITRLIVAPTGQLGEIALAYRLLAAAVALVIYFALRRNVLAGVTAAALTIAAVAAF